MPRNERPAVAVITPTELRPERLGYLEELHGSLIAQEAVSWEWIISPNGKTADPDRIPQAIARDPRVKVCARKRGGAAPARNTALNYVTADYVTDADDDDLLSLSSLAVRHQRLIETGLGWVAGLSADLTADGTLHTWVCPTPVGGHDAGDVWTYWPSPMESKPPMGHTMIMARTELARACGHGGMHKGEDYAFVMGVTGQSAGELLPDIVYNYRDHEHQWTEQADYRDQAEYDARIFAWNLGKSLHRAQHQQDTDRHGGHLAA
ncbi:glycosyltransferase family 2 protein [Streptomyces sp. NPDC058268]|uniref:glycosyltransferase family 2 protein n=1 Tax=Streptomyces sp. NPDC058268 TaxID=3346413 RepID=UPI0036E48FD8